MIFTVGLDIIRFLLSIFDSPVAGGVSLLVETDLTGCPIPILDCLYCGSGVTRNRRGTGQVTMLSNVVLVISPFFML